MSDFESKLNDMKKAADKLVSTLDGTNIGAAKSAFISVGRTCGACHKIYRGPKL
jgi:cytochrome c556